MYWVYALKSAQHNWIYVGMTNNIERRVEEHNRGGNRSTKPYAPFYLIFQQEYSSTKAAREAEKYYKTAAGKRYLRSLLDEDGSLKIIVD